MITNELEKQENEFTKKYENDVIGLSENLQVCSSFLNALHSSLSTSCQNPNYSDIRFMFDHRSLKFILIRSFQLLEPIKEKKREILAFQSVLTTKILELNDLASKVSSDISIVHFSTEISKGREANAVIAVFSTPKTGCAGEILHGDQIFGQNARALLKGDPHSMGKRVRRAQG